MGQHEITIIRHVNQDYSDTKLGKKTTTQKERRPAWRRWRRLQSHRPKSPAANRCRSNRPSFERKWRTSNKCIKRFETTAIFFPQIAAQSVKK